MFDAPGAFIPGAEEVLYHGNPHADRLKALAVSGRLFSEKVLA